MFIVDTNVLVYAANAGCPEHSRCQDLLQRWMGAPTPWYVTWGILYEFLRIVTHPRVFPNPWTLRSAWQFVEVLLDSPGLTVLTGTQRHAAVCAAAMEKLRGFGGNIVHDIHTVALMREHGIKVIYTRDADFHRFTDITPIDPLTESA